MRICGPVAVLALLLLVAGIAAPWPFMPLAALLGVASLRDA